MLVLEFHILGWYNYHCVLISWCNACSVSSGDSMSRPIPPTRGIKRPTCGTLKKYLISATDFHSRPTNIVGLSIVLCSPIRQ